MKQKERLNKNAKGKGQPHNFKAKKQRVIDDIGDRHALLIKLLKELRLKGRGGDPTI